LPHYFLMRHPPPTQHNDSNYIIRKWTPLLLYFSTSLLLQDKLDTQIG